KTPDELIAEALAALHKKGIPVMKLGDEAAVKHISSVPTGSYSLDHALGVGGFPKGRIIEVFGEYSSGKSLLCLSACAQAQQAGGRAAFIDAEHSIDPEWAEKLGVDTKELYFVQPDSGEEALTALEKLVETHAFDIIVVDSVAALVPQAEIDAEMDKHSVAMQARLISKALRKLTGKIYKSNTVVAFTNQLRMKVGVMFGNPEDTPGGKALKFYASVRCEVKKMTGAENRFHNSAQDLVGHNVTINVIKNKVAPPYRKAEFSV
ncbi:unnamed protein product, partial [marine sediment metagenome]